MKQYFWLLQILVYVLVQIFPMKSVRAHLAVNGNYGKLSEIASFTENFTVIPEGLKINKNTQATLTISTEPRMPHRYKLPSKIYLTDSTVFFSQFQDQVGQRATVEGIIARVGPTLNEEIKEKVFRIEQKYKGKAYILLSLTSTLEDANILKSQFEADGKAIEIVEIPDWYQEKLLEISTLKNTNPVQYVKPTKRDIQFAMVSSTIGGAVLTGGMMAIGLDPALLILLTVLNISIIGATAAYNEAIANLVKRSIQKMVAEDLTNKSRHKRLKELRDRLKFKNKAMELSLNLNCKNLFTH